MQLTKDNVHVLNTKVKKNCEMFLYPKNPDTFQKEKQFPLRFDLQGA